MNESNNKLMVACLGIVCLTALEIAAIYKELDGSYFGSVVAGIGLIAGYMFGIRAGEKKALAEAE